MRKNIYIFFVIVSVFCFTGCTAFVDTRREAGQVQPVGQSAPHYLALCYNPMFHDQGELQALADKTCASGKATYDRTRYFNCTLFYPNTAFYKCE